MKLAIEADQLAFNNRWFVTFEIRKPQRILVLADGVDKASVFVRALKACLYQVDQRSALDEKIDDSGYDAVFLDGVAVPGEGLWNKLAVYVQNGGGLGIIPGGDAMKPAAPKYAACPEGDAGEDRAKGHAGRRPHRALERGVGFGPSVFPSLSKLVYLQQWHRQQSAWCVPLLESRAPASGRLGPLR